MYNVPVMFLLHKVVSGTEGNKMCIVGRCRDGHTTSTPHVGVAQLVRQNLQFIRREVVVIPQYMVVGRSTCTLGRKNKSHVKIEIRNRTHF